MGWWGGGVGSSRVGLCSKWLQMGPNNHINSSFVPFQPKSLPKVENGQKWSWFELCSKWALIIISIDILAYFSQNVDQKWKMVKIQVGSNFAQNDSKWALIIISRLSDILAHFSQKVDQKWKMVKSEVGSIFAQNDSKMGPNSHIKWYFVPVQANVDQKWLMVKSEVGSNLAPNGP